jgi:Ca-activated chloride channel family protein
MLEFFPDRPALCHDKPCTMDLLVRITPPRPEGRQERPPINLSLVVDRSGSMQGEKIELTRKAAALAVKSLSRDDRLSIVSFANDVITVVGSTQVADKEAMLKQIERIEAYGSTALFDGWIGGAAQACLALDARRLNRVVLLTDGQANIGETNPDSICSEVHRLAQQGLQTTTLGFGKDYHEGLLRSMAASGGGNHFFVETPDQLVRFMELELDGLAATLGTRVRLSFLRQTEAVEIEPLGEVQMTPDGSYQLADLMIDFPLELLFRVVLPAGQSIASGLVAQLHWHSPGTGQSHSLQLPLELPRVSAQERAALPLHPDVEVKLAVAMAARARQEAMQAMDRGDNRSATRILKDALETRKLPELEKAQLTQLQSSMNKGDTISSKKIFESHSYAYSRGSVVLGAIEEQLLSGWMDAGLVPLRYATLFRQAPPGSPELSRLEGMMAGLFRGDSSGEAALLSLETLRSVTGKNRFLPWIAGFFKRIAAASVAHPSPVLVEFRQRVDQGESFLSCGVRSHDCGALCRLAPLLLTRGLSPSASHWVFVIVGSHITHNDAASAASCVAQAHLLWELMLAPAPPSSHYYLNRFLDILTQVEQREPYAATAPRYDGWVGPLSEYLPMVMGEARRRGLTYQEARQEWGSGETLLETVPAMLYLLECHGHQPEVAMRQVVGHPCLGPLVGAALGALHGVQPGWELKGAAADAYREYSAQQ